MNPLRSKVGRSIYGLSAVLVGLPIVLTGVFSLIQIERSFVAGMENSLEQAVRIYGRLVLERLIAASDSLQPSLLLDLSEVPKSNAYFSELTVAETPAAVSTPLPTEAVRPLLSIDESTSPPGLRLSMSLGHRTLTGLLRREHLWGSQEELAYGVDLCVLATGRGTVLHCSGAIPAEVREQIQNSVDPSGVLRWAVDGEDQVSAYWELFTSSIADGPLLRIVVSEPEAVAFETLADFRRFYLPTLFAIVVFVFLAAGIYTQRTLGPLSALLQLTHQYRRRNFSAAVELPRDDEFADLGNALQNMAANLSRQFATMGVLSKLDQLILAGKEPDQVIELVLNYLSESARWERAAILLVDRHDAERGIVYSRTASKPVANRRTQLDKRSRALLQQQTLTLLDPAVADHAELLALIAPGEPSATLVRAVFVRGQLGGAIFVAGPSRKDRTEELEEIGSRLAVALDVVERRGELRRRAYFDDLTGLPNRELCFDRLEQALSQAKERLGEVALLFIDLDQFKSVNDSMGHGAGDELIRQAAQRIDGCVGEVETTARLGGDEFAVVIPQVSAEHDAGDIADAILRVLREPFAIGNARIHLSASIGIAQFPEDGDSSEDLLKKADTAMYRAKEAGRGQSVNYSHTMGVQVQRRLVLEADLRHALERHEFKLLYQPQVDLNSHRVVGAEALLRWIRPDCEPIEPAEFVPIAEETGLIHIIGLWSMFEACRQLKEWRHAGLDIDRIAVNVSPRQFHTLSFVADVEDCLGKLDLEPSALEIELTESVFVDDLKRAAATIAQLKALGVSIAIDDFGTGYSSLSYLKDLQFDVVKIDQAFMRGVPSDQEAVAIINAIVAMSRTLGKTVIAEGVESHTQLAHLRQSGIHIVQGYSLGKPMPAGALAELLSRGGGERIALGG